MYKYFPCLVLQLNLQAFREAEERLQGLDVHLASAAVSWRFLQLSHVATWHAISLHCSGLAYFFLLKEECLLNIAGPIAKFKKKFVNLLNFLI